MRKIGLIVFSNTRRVASRARDQFHSLKTLYYWVGMSLVFVTNIFTTVYGHTNLFTLHHNTSDKERFDVVKVIVCPATNIS